MRRLAPLSVLLAVTIVSCGPLPRSRLLGGGGGGGGGDAAFTSQCRGDFGASAVANRFEAFMGATWEFHQAATETQQALLSACQEMGRALEVPAAQLSGSGAEGTRSVCAAVTQQLQTDLNAIRAGTNLTVEVRTQPPRCEAHFDAYAECAASCDVNVTPGELELRCEGGEIRGQCSGQCSGSCAVDVEARCEGRCDGICDGTCSARGADGACAGSCDGTCRGECVAEASAQCTGECRGSCSVEWERPYCTGSYDPPEVDAECQAACEGRVEASMECTPGQAELAVTGGPDAETQARMERVGAAIRVGLGAILAVREKVQRLQRTGQVVLRELRTLPDAIEEAGLAAAACSAGAILDLQNSLSSISVSVEVSVSVSASAEVR